MNKTVLISIGIFMTTPVSASALEISAMGLLDQGKVTSDLNTRYTSNSAFGFGSLLSFGFDSSFNIEVGALFAPRKYELVQSGSDTTINYNTLQFPILCRFSFLNVASVGAGAFFEKVFGNVTYRDNLSGTESSFSWDDRSMSTLGSTNLGLEIAAGVRFPLFPMTHLRLDGRYLLGLTNINYTGYNTVKTRDFQFLAGVAFGL